MPSNNVVATEADKILKELRSRRQHATRKTKNKRAKERWQHARTKLASARAFTKAGGQSRHDRAERAKTGPSRNAAVPGRRRLPRKRHASAGSAGNNNRQPRTPDGEGHRKKKAVRQHHRHRARRSQHAGFDCWDTVCSRILAPHFDRFGNASTDSPSLVIPYVYLGDRHDASNKRRLKHLGVSHVLNCAHQPVRGSLPLSCHSLFLRAHPSLSPVRAWCCGAIFLTPENSTPLPM